MTIKTTTIANATTTTTTATSTAPLTCHRPHRLYHHCKTHFAKRWGRTVGLLALFVFIKCLKVQSAWKSKVGMCAHLLYRSNENYRVWLDVLDVLCVARAFHYAILLESRLDSMIWLDLIIKDDQWQSWLFGIAKLNAQECCSLKKGLLKPWGLKSPIKHYLITLHIIWLIHNLYMLDRNTSLLYGQACVK